MKTLQDNYRLAIARQRLKYWAVWCQDNLTQGLRFPSQNIIGKLISNRGEIIHSTNQTSEIENQEAEEIDKLINIPIANENAKKELHSDRRYDPIGRCQDNY